MNTNNIFSRDWQPREKSDKSDKKYDDFIIRARREIDLADHLVYVTLPLVDDIKFLLAIIDHVYNAASLAVEASLEQKRHYKMIEPFPRTYLAMVDIWKNQVMTNAFDRRHLDFLKRVQEVKHSITTSSMRFKRQDKYILTNDVYDLKILDLITVKKYLSIAKDFLDISEKLIVEEDKKQNIPE